jgi:hypothetical protein
VLPLFPPRRSLIAIAGALLPLSSACDDAAAEAPKIEIYIDDTLAGAAPAIDFPDTPTESLGVAAQIEIKNLGPTTLLLEGSPPVILERDDRLAFRVTQPATRIFPKGESVVFSVVFAPHSPGSSAARLVIDTNASEAPLVFALTGEGIEGATPLLVATIDGAPVGSSFDFGAARPFESVTANLRLANGGTGVLDLGSSPVTLSGADKSAFELGEVTASALAEGEHVDVPVTFTPGGCETYHAVLTIDHAAAASPLDVLLTGRGGENPQGHADVTDTELLDAPDVDVALSSAVSQGPRRFAVGNLTVGGYAGQVRLFAWDGCTLSSPKTISAASSGLDAQLFGNQVALADDGQTLLVTARDQRKDAWIFSVDSAGEPHFVATLATFDEAAGHGRGGALAGDGSVAFIGQAMADSGFNAHGAVFVYPKPAAGWQPAPESRFRLVPSAPTQVELIGSWVETSRTGDVVVSGALQTPVGAGSKGPATAYVWAATHEEGERRWGDAIPAGEPNERSETLRLLSNQVPSDSAARVAVSADGNSIAMSTPRDSDVQIRLYTRSGAEPWGKPTASPDERLPTALVTLTASPSLRLALGPAGEFLIAADQGGARELARPTGGWNDDAAPSRTWNVPFYGSLAVAPDGVAFAGTDKNGAAWFVYR